MWLTESHFQSCYDKKKTRKLVHLDETLCQTQKLIKLLLNLCSPCNDVRGETHHKCTDECTDLLGGPHSPPLLLVQTFLAHTNKVQRHHYLPRRYDQRHADIMKQST